MSFLKDPFIQIDLLLMHRRVGNTMGVFMCHSPIWLR